MKPSEIRAELLTQHEDLRARIDEARRLIDRQARGDESDLHGSLVRLTDVVRLHNAREEELMRDVFPTLDAWGPTRAEVMHEGHVHEHEALFASLVAARDASSGESLASVRKLLDDMLAHMDREEKVFLCKEVLCDDGVVPDYFGG